jgi:phospholipase C
MSVEQDQAAGLPPTQGTALLRSKIQNVVVLMLENRSFDHLLGDLPGASGIQPGMMNLDFRKGGDPVAEVSVRKATSPAMPFDPNHEFTDVSLQLSLKGEAGDGMAAPMGGFLESAQEVAGPNPDDAARVMEYFVRDQLPALYALAAEFAVCNSWHSSLPGPTFPNRFFVHAATSGGLTQSPSEVSILEGFSFEQGTVYSKLSDGGRSWRIYHDGLPQCAALTPLRGEYINPFTDKFQAMEQFSGDVDAGRLPDYTFIEPDYDTSHQYQQGNSMHPRDDVRKGETLVRSIYEKLRNSSYWPKLLFLVVFDEHGGFYDHVVPPEAMPPGGAEPYANPYNFAFDRYGVRVPAIVISAYTQKGTLIDKDTAGDPIVFDHSSVYRTLQDRFDLAYLTDRANEATSLSIALNLEVPRLDAASALTALPASADLSAFGEGPALAAALAPVGAEPLGENPNLTSMLGVAVACDHARAPDAAGKSAVLARREKVGTQAEALAFIRQVDDSIKAGRKKR